MTKALGVGGLRRAEWETCEATQENADRLFPPSDIGPIWVKDTFGNWLLPEYTLGWDVIAWAESNLSAIRGSGPLQLTPEQMRVILWYYAIDEDGEFVYEHGVWQAFKGAGKDPFGAVLAVVELIGPCRFEDWEYHEDGSKTPITRDEPDAWVQLVGVAKSQTHNTMKHIPKLLNKQVRAEYKLDVQKEIVYAMDGTRRLEMVGSSPGVLEGNPITWALLNETQHWLPSQGGQDLYNVIYDNVGKTHGARLLCITNAYEPGQGSVAEDIRNAQERVWAGMAEDSGWLYMSREAHPKAPLDPDWVPFIMRTIVGDAWWQIKNMKSLSKRVLDSSRPASRTRRMYYNQIVTAEDAFFDQAEWDGARAEGTYGTEADLKPGDEIVLGFDGGKTDDATALVAIRIKDKLIVPILVEQKPDGPLGDGWEVNRQLVDEEVRRAFAVYRVRAFFADVNLWESYIATWSEDFREHLLVKATPNSTIGWDMRGSKERVAKTWELYRSSLIDGRLKHNGNKILRVHALNAKRGHNGKGLTARKESPESPRKIDVMVASYVAFAALQALLENGKRPQRTHRQRANGPRRTMVRQ